MNVMPEAYGVFARDDNYIYRTEAQLAWGNGVNSLGLIIMLNPGSSKLKSKTLWEDIEDKKINIAQGELELDETMKAVANILHDSHPKLDGVLHIRNLFNIRDSDANSALELYGKYCAGTITADEKLMHTDFETLLTATTGRPMLLDPTNPWIWLAWTVEDKRFLNKRKEKVWKLCNKLSDVELFAIYSQAKKFENSRGSIHTYHPLPRNSNNKAKYRADMGALMKEYWKKSMIKEKIYVVAMSDDEAYVLLKRGDSYALKYNGVDPQQADWVEGNGLVVSVDVKDVSGYYQWFDPPKPYIIAKNK
mgnify:CR=1 FL=1